MVVAVGIGSSRCAAAAADGPWDVLEVHFRRVWVEKRMQERGPAF